MKKSIYSLVLMDDVVEAVDRMAYAMHTSRSNLINQILAEHLSCVTPEMRMQSVFSRMEQQMLQQFRMLEQTSAHVLALQSPLAYKYKPTIQYSVELYRAPKDGADGRLRVQLRTQNRELLAMLDGFFRFWMLLEQETAPPGTAYRISPGRLERTLQMPEGGSTEVFGELIGLYINRLDADIKAYFAGAAAPEETLAQLQQRYHKEQQQQPLYL